MRYYLIPAAIASEHGLDRIRRGNKERGYVVNIGDCVCMTDEQKGQLVEITRREAAEFVESLKQK